MNLLNLKRQERHSKVVFYNRAEESWQWVNTANLLIDIFFILISTTLVFYIRFAPELYVYGGDGKFDGILDNGIFSITNYELFSNYIGFLVLYLALIVLLFKNYELYSTSLARSWVDEALLVFKSVSIATLIMMVVMYLAKQQVSRLVVLFSWAINILLLAGWRYVGHTMLQRRIKSGGGLRRVLIVGAGRVGQKLAEMLENNHHLGLEVKGFVDDFKLGKGILGRISDMPRILRSQFIDEVYVTILSERELVKTVTKEALIHKADVKIIPDLLDGIVPQSRPLSLGFLGDLPIMEIYRKPIPELGLFIKRAIDLVCGFFMFLVTLPVLIVVALVIKIDSPDGPVIYRSKRVGKKGEFFYCYKFRTMSANADDLKDKLRELNERSGPFFKINDDPRITRVGRFLRKYSLDELPQMFNLINGDMSLVGPRPHPLDDFKLYDLEDYRRLDVKPGITSLWAVEARNDPSFERNMDLDLFYIENWSIWLDLSILLKTVPTVLKGSGI
jgi:exopolysaccharide biosynthesis polyprenyl glycosylphosphotransferase